VTALSGTTKFEGTAVEEVAGRAASNVLGEECLWRSEGRVVGGELVEDVVNGASVGVEPVAEAFGVLEERASAALDGRIVAGGEFVVEEWMLGEESEAKGGECVFDEVDDDDLGRDDEASKLARGHRFFADGALVRGVCAKTSR
jgi:hypothetical protein